MGHNLMYGLARLEKQRRFSIAHQLINLKRVCPTGEGKFCRKQGLVWRYDTQPTPVSRTYEVRIDYKLDKPPSIFILKPNLRDLAGNNREIPHLYSQTKQQLCLYKPDKGEWSSKMLLSEVLLPWVELWLFYFEDWLTSDEWKGGGEHPKH